MDCKGYYTHGDYWGYIPGPNGAIGDYQKFETHKEYLEAYAEATAS